MRRMPLASIPESEKPEEYRSGESWLLEGTSYEYPQRRLTTTDLKARYKIRGKTRVEALSSRRSGEQSCIIEALDSV